jgi:HTH-type transcriptional regulator, sugar sensing transcriptional regulator
MDNIKLINKLKRIGLTDKMAMVYVSILELGVAFPSKIAKDTRLNRTTVYHVLDDLAIKGLVTEIERKNKICYQIEKPSKILNYTKSQIRLAKERVAQAEKALPEIEGLYSLTPNKPRVRYFEGIDGIMNVYDDHVCVDKNYEMIAFSNVQELMKLLPERFVHKYIKKKQQLGITSRAIFPDNSFSKKYNKEIYSGIENKFLVKKKYIPKEMFPYNADITVYANKKVSIINFQKNNLIGVIIEDSTIASMMSMIFELSWNSTKVSVK